MGPGEQQCQTAKFPCSSRGYYGSHYSFLGPAVSGMLANTHVALPFQCNTGMLLLIGLQVSQHLRESAC